MVKLFYFGIGLLNAAVSVGCVNYYFAKLPQTYEPELLHATANFIREYDGDNPKEALDYAITTFDITRTFNPEEIGELEKKASEISSEIGDSSSEDIYKPVLEQFSEEIDTVSAYKNNGSYLLLGGVCGAIAFYSWLNAGMFWKKD